MLSEDGFHMNDLGYRCMAEVLATGIARRVTRPPN
jgi:lysophospholipase L1-like esterase